MKIHSYSMHAVKTRQSHMGHCAAGPESKRQRSEQKQSGRALEVASAGWLASCMLMFLQVGNTPWNSNQQRYSHRYRKGELWSHICAETHVYILRVHL